MQRVQAELRARTSFRDAVRILEGLLPVSPTNHESVRTRTHAVAQRLEAADQQAAVAENAAGAAAAASQSIVLLDGAYVCAVPGQQIRNFEVVCGKVEQEGRPSRHFALVRSVAERPPALLGAALREQGWREDEPVTAISDGDPALPALVRSATKGPVEHILDWFHLSMRVRHVEQAMASVCGLIEPMHGAPLDPVQVDVERLRHLLWHGQQEKASEALNRIASWAADIELRNGGAVEHAGRLLARCTALRVYIEANEGALIDYGQRYRAGKPISTSRAEGTVNHLISARMNKRQQMRWSPKGDHRVLQVRAAVLDGRFGQQANHLTA
jgi:hypothetical protein